MENSLESLIAAEIRTHGPIGIDRFMDLALAHPRLGYYITRDRLGAAGDFTTAPEISQLFGEMVGLCLADAWLRAGAPRVHLVELGPGRGTLMADLLRATRRIPDFHARCDIHLVETSPALRAKQAEALAGFAPVWHDSADTLPTDAPLLAVANEFFDALPVRLAEMTAQGWRERVVGLDDAGRLTYGYAALPFALPPLPAGSVIEFAPARERVMDGLARRIATQGGLLLAIDYGHDTPAAVGDTFQALYRHTYSHPLAHIGQSDLTSHVDFHRLKVVAAQAGCTVHGSVTQKHFLESLGIQLRLERLNAPQLAEGARRLTDPEGMGGLFRVLGVSSSPFCPSGL